MTIELDTGLDDNPPMLPSSRRAVLRRVEWTIGDYRRDKFRRRKSTVIVSLRVHATRARNN